MIQCVMVESDEISFVRKVQGSLLKKTRKFTNGSTKRTSIVIHSFVPILNTEPEDETPR